MLGVAMDSELTFDARKKLKQSWYIWHGITKKSTRLTGLNLSSILILLLIYCNFKIDILYVSWWSTKELKYFIFIRYLYLSPAWCIFFDKCNKTLFSLSALFPASVSLPTPDPLTLKVPLPSPALLFLQAPLTPTDYSCSFFSRSSPSFSFF